MPYDIATIPPSFVTKLRVPASGASQCFAIDPATGDIYAAVADDATGSAIIYRLTPDGALLDFQKLKGVGHPVQIGLERDGANVYIWGYWMTPEGYTDTSSRFPFRWRFVGQSYASQVLSTDATVERMPKVEGGVWQEFSIDQTADLVTMRIVTTPGETLTTYVQRKFSELKAGIGSRLGTVVVQNFSATYGAPQGQAGDAQYVYAAFGGGRVGQPTYVPPVIVRIDWATGTPTVVNVGGLNAEGGADGSYAELEGVFTYRRGPTDYEIMFGVLTGGSGGWDSMVYTFRPIPDPSTWAVRAVSVPAQTTVPLSDSNNFALYNAANPVTLYRMNGTATIAAELKLLTPGYIDGQVTHTALILPPGYLPRGLTNGAALTRVCQGSGNNRFTMTITAAGNLVIWRYGPEASASGAWLPMYESWPTA